MQSHGGPCERDPGLDTGLHQYDGVDDEIFYQVYFSGDLYIHPYA